MSQRVVLPLFTRGSCSCSDSFKWWGFEQETYGYDASVKKGYHSLIQHLHDRFTKANGITHLESIVAKVHHNESEATLEVATAGGVTYIASRVICTLPLGVLQRGDVEFSPPLPTRRREALGRLGMGLLNKV